MCATIEPVVCRSATIEPVVCRSATIGPMGKQYTNGMLVYRGLHVGCTVCVYPCIWGVSSSFNSISQLQM